MLFVTAAALVDEQGRVLMAKRPEGKPMAGLWEFPGGKVHSDETPEEALVRELREELGIKTSTCCLSPLTFVTHPLSDDTGQPDQERSLEERMAIGGCNPLRDCPPQDPDNMLLLLLYVCRRWHGTPASHEGQKLKWLKPTEMFRHPMPPADKPLVHILQATL
jgi:8-oxo-dGTP diphosphatase